ncbi:MAG: ATP-binding protein [Planctomycetota bacterium]
MTTYGKSALILGLTTGLGSAGLAGGTSAWFAPLPQPAWFIVAGGAVALGVLAAAVPIVLGRSAKRDIDALTNFARTVAQAESDAQTAPPRMNGGLSQAARAMSQTVRQLTQEINGLHQHRRELELTSRVSEAERRNLEAILNAISDGVVVTDAFNEVTLANGAAARALEFELEQSLRRPLEEILVDPRLVKLIKDTRDAGPAMRRSVEHKLRESSTYQVTTTCVGGDATEKASATGVVTVLRDVTKDKEIAEMKSDFVSKVSHELRTPLSSIKAYIEMLIDGEAHDEETRAEFYDIVQNETNRLQRLIDNILSISRIESGVVKVHREPVSLPALVADCVEVLQPQAAMKSITLTEQPYPASFEVFADRDMIYQATMNLISNAVKYTPDGGTVDVWMDVDEHDRTVSVSVKDSGVGIPADDLPNLFQKFFRVQSNNKVAKGTGLGLNLVKHVVETVHDGRIDVKSEVGKGSTFIYTLPIADN